MKKILSLIVSLLVLATPVLAAEETELADAGITPNSPVYGLDRAMERIQLAITFGEAEKAKLKFKFAEERLAEARIATGVGIGVSVGTGVSVGGAKVNVGVGKLDIAVGVLKLC